MKNNIPFLPPTKKKEKKSRSGATTGTGTSGCGESSSSSTTTDTKSGDEVVMIMDVANRFVKQPIEGLVNGISNVVEKVVPFPTSSSSSSSSGKKKDAEKVSIHTTNERGELPKESSSSTNNSSTPGTSTTATATATATTSPSSSSTPTSTSTQAITKDETLQNMQIVLQNQSLKQISIKEFYDACFGEGSDMYEEWINSYGDKYNIQITPWEYNNNNGDDDGQRQQQFTNEWNDEKFPQRRIITYSYDRDPSTLGYSLGEPTVHVTQVQYFSQTSNKGILSVEMSMVGEVCANCFHVQIRGVATQQVGSNDVSVDFGVYCVFTKQVLIGGKIRDITKDATRSQMIDMFAMMQQYCGQQDTTTTTTTNKKKTPSIASATLIAVEEEEEKEHDDQDNKDKNDITSCWQQYLCDPFKTKNQEIKKKDQPMDDIDLELHAIDRKYRSICLLDLVVVDPSKKPSSSSPPQQLPPSEIKFIKSEFDIAKESLNHILVRDIQAEKFNTSTSDASTSETTTTTSKSVGSLIERPRPFTKTMTRIRERIVPSIDSVGLTTNTLFNKVASIGRQYPVVDATINGMNVIIKDTIEDISLDEFYDAIFKEHIFLKTMENSGKFNIQVGPWEKPQGDHKKKDGLFVDSWNGERYHMRRNFSYDYRFFNNSKDDIVKHNISSNRNNREEEKLTSRASRTFFARKDGNSKVVLQIRDDGSSNVQVSNTCEVMIRWVVTPIVDEKAKNENSRGNPGRNRLLLKIGQFVVMKNHSVLARKLRSEATQYAMHNQRQMLKEFKDILGANQDSAGNETDSLLQEARILSDENTFLLGETKNVGNSNIPCFSFRKCLPCNLCETSRFPPGTIIASDDDLVTMATNLERKLKAVHAILEADRKFADSTEDLHFYLSQLFIVREALDNILQKYCTHDEKPLEEVRNLSSSFF